MPYLFIVKVGAYMHGVWWIGLDKDEAIARCNELASSDCDNHHEWRVLEFKESNVSRPEVWGDGTDHELIYCTDKSKLDK